MKLAFLGLGAMGFPMASHLRKKTKSSSGNRTAGSRRTREAVRTRAVAAIEECAGCGRGADLRSDEQRSRRDRCGPRAEPEEGNDLDRQHQRRSDDEPRDRLPLQRAGSSFVERAGDWRNAWRRGREADRG